MTPVATPLALLLTIPWLYGVYRLFRKARSQAHPFPGLARMPMIVTWRQRLTLLPPTLMAAGTAMLIVAAARPQTLLSQSRRTTDAIAIEMAVDISGSMLALDFSEPGAASAHRKTRLDVVKETFAEFVNRRPHDLIGLVTFGGFATTRCPLTLDHQALLHVLAGVKVPGQDGEPVDQMEQMTAIGDGLALACARLNAVTNVKSRIIILLSDGESNAGIITPEQATAVARQLNIKVYAIGVGTTGYAEAIGRDRFGREVVGRMFVSMDEAELKRIAEETGGRYFSVLDRDGLEAAMEEIDALETTAIDETVYTRYQERYRHFLIPGLLACLLAVLLATPSRRTLL